MNNLVEHIILIALLAGVGFWNLVMAILLVVERIRDATQNSTTFWLASTYLFSAINIVWITAVIALIAWTPNIVDQGIFMLVVRVGIGIQAVMAVGITFLMWHLRLRDKSE